MLIPVSDIADPRLEPFRDLPEKTLQREQDLFIAEGLWLVQRLLASKVPAACVLASAKRADEIAPAVPVDLPLYVVPDSAMHDLVGFKFHTGVLAAARRPKNPPLQYLIGPAGVILVCPKIISPDNLGSILRIAASFGADGVLLGSECCDPWRRKTVRVSMGTIFNVPVRVSDDLEGDLCALRDRHGVQLIATVLDESCEPLNLAPRPSRLALLLGPEDQGLDDRWLALCDRRVTIPMSRGTDSLNVAIAAAVFLYHFTRVAAG